jgi:hypothetical protein
MVHEEHTCSGGPTNHGPGEIGGGGTSVQCKSANVAWSRLGDIYVEAMMAPSQISSVACTSKSFNCADETINDYIHSLPLRSP